MSADYHGLAARLGFEERYVEKACRVSDLIRGVSQLPFLRDRLSLYGGTALAFVYFPETYRLSVDVDFNYRHIGGEDWGTTRNGIDRDLKTILYALRYTPSDISIDASYPLGRFTVNYVSRSGLKDSFKIEVGYMRRIPVLREDALEAYRHPAGGESFRVLIPRREELLSNKWCTMLYRGSSRDLFDVYRLSDLPMDLNTFRTCAIVDSLMRGPPKIHEIDVEARIRGIPMDSGLTTLLLRGLRSFDPDEARRRAIEFSEEILSGLSPEQRKAIDVFHDEARFEPELIDEKGVLNQEIKTHPMILRALQTRK